VARNACRKVQATLTRGSRCNKRSRSSR
jgi:hypothetical protein